MKQRGILTALTIVSMVLYPWLYRRLFGLGAVYLLPSGLLRAARDLGGSAMLTALQWSVTLILAVALATPIAVLVALAFRKAWWVVALLFGILLLAPDIAGIPDMWREIDNREQLIGIFAMNFVSVLVVPLILTYAALRLTSNMRAPHREG
jgi:hypothetical protein